MGKRNDVFVHMHNALILFRTFQPALLCLLAMLTNRSLADDYGQARLSLKVPPKCLMHYHGFPDSVCPTHLIMDHHRLDSQAEPNSLS
jgi:hypothetical protein